MSKRVVKFTLDAKSISKAVKEIQEYKREVLRKTNELRKRIAERIAEDASSGFASAIVDDLLPNSGGARGANVSVEVSDSGNTTLVIANGQDAVWCEFGAGVYHNGSVGSSPHPKGAELGFTIGSYGKGLGSKTVWGFYEGGELRLTHGAPASMPMYTACQKACDEIANIAREVFGA